MRTLVTENLERDSEDKSFGAVCHVENIEHGIVPASCTELVCNDSLDYTVDREQALLSCVKKLRYDGRIVITGVDIEEVTRELASRRISVLDAINILYRGRNSASSLNIMIDMLRQCGLEILFGRIDNFHYFVTAVRNAAKSS